MKPTQLKKRQIDWGQKSKQKARRITIIDCYRNNFGHRLPANKQYWTMCGDCAINGKLIRGCEPDQIVRAGLIRPEQFYGVEINPEIHKSNEEIKGGYHWLDGTFLRRMLNASASEAGYNPGIIFYDTLSFLGTHDILKDLKKMMVLIGSMNIHNVLLIVNNIIRSRVTEINPRQILYPLFERKEEMQILKTYGWHVMDVVYEYKGTGRNKNIRMGVTGFVKY